MDKLKIRMGLMRAFGDDAEQRRKAKLKAAYSNLSPELAAVAESQDAAVDAAKLPDMVGDIDSGASAAGPAVFDAMSLEDDEEMQKWMAKQKG